MAKQHIKIKDEEKSIGDVEEVELRTKASHLEKFKTKLILILYTLAIVTFIYLAIDIYETAQYFDDDDDYPSEYDRHFPGEYDQPQVNSNVREEIFSSESPDSTRPDFNPEHEAAPVEEEESTTENSDVPIRYIDEDDYPHSNKESTHTETKNEADSIKLAKRNLI